MPAERSALSVETVSLQLGNSVIRGRCLGCDNCTGICAALMDAITLPALIQRRPRYDQTP